MFGVGDALEPVGQFPGIGVFRVIELHLTFGCAILNAKSLDAHVGDFERRFEWTREMIQFTGQREKFADLIRGELKLNWTLIVRRFLVCYLPGLLDCDRDILRNAPFEELRVFQAGHGVDRGKPDDGSDYEHHTENGDSHSAARMRCSE